MLCRDGLGKEVCQSVMFALHSIISYDYNKLFHWKEGSENCGIGVGRQGSRHLVKI